MESMAVMVVPLAVGSLLAVCFSLNSPSIVCQMAVCDEPVPVFQKIRSSPALTAMLPSVTVPESSHITLSPLLRLSAVHVLITATVCFPR